MKGSLITHAFQEHTEKIPTNRIPLRKCIKPQFCAYLGRKYYKVNRLSHPPLDSYVAPCWVPHQLRTTDVNGTKRDETDCQRENHGINVK